MPSRTKPTFTRAEVEAHSSSSSCYVTIGTNVYDMTEFMDDHPGGGSLILDYAGRDVKDILNDEASHFHSEAAYEILDDYHVGFVVPQKSGEPAAGAGADADEDSAAHPRTGMSCEEDLSKETDYNQDYKRHKFLDLSRPLFPQIWFGGFSKDFYLDQVHRPRHYKGGLSAPLFGNFLEPLTKTPWWVIPSLWMPCVAYGTYQASQGIDSSMVLAGYWVFGLFIWTFVEYGLHRFLFHLDDYLPDNRVGITAHFLLHGIHHYLPMDKYRLVMPPTLFVLLAAPFWKLAHALFFHSWYAATAIYCGGIFGYICYDMTHYFLHHQNLPLWYKQLKKYHLEHHFLDYENGFGVTSRFWDDIFGTGLDKPPVIKTQ
jgi:4-hydroxysphinganine ceramide fatty acyl 2-hydroxylase